jgi:hypothetical protein
VKLPVTWRLEVPLLSMKVPPPLTPRLKFPPTVRLAASELNTPL